MLRSSVFTDASPGSPLSNGTHSFANLTWVSHNGVAYVVLDGSAATSQYVVSNVDQVGSWSSIDGAEGNASVSMPVFSAAVCHGAAPQNASYAYAVVPNVTEDSVVDTVATFLSTVAVVCNNERAQAVMALSPRYGGSSSRSRGEEDFAGPAVVLHAVFWEAAEVSTDAASVWPVVITADTAVVVTLVRNVTALAVDSGHRPASVGGMAALGDMDVAIAALDRSAEAYFEIVVLGTFVSGGNSNGNATVSCKPDGAGHTVVSGAFPSGVRAGSSVTGRCKVQQFV